MVLHDSIDESIDVTVIQIGRLALEINLNPFETCFILDFFTWV